MKKNPRDPAQWPLPIRRNLVIRGDVVARTGTYVDCTFIASAGSESLVVIEEPNTWFIRCVFLWEYGLLIRSQTWIMG